MCLRIQHSVVGFNVPLKTTIGHFKDDYMGQMTQPTVYQSWSQKTEVPGQPDGENHTILGSLVLRQYQHVTDDQTDRHAAKLCPNTAECNKKK